MKRLSVKVVDYDGKFLTQVDFWGVEQEDIVFTEKDEYFFIKTKSGKRIQVVFGNNTKKEFKED